MKNGGDADPAAPCATPSDIIITVIITVALKQVIYIVFEEGFNWLREATGISSALLQ